MSAPRPLAQHLESPTDEARISRMWRVRRAQRQSTPRRSSAWLAVPLAAAVVGVLAWVAWPDADVVPTPRATAPVEVNVLSIE